MASIILENVTVDFPIYESQRTFRGALRQATGGLIQRKGSHNQHVSVRAINNISMTLKHGDRLGIVGHNGAGKSTFLRVCAGVYAPTLGVVHIEGRVSPLLDASPGLDAEDTGYENIVTCGLLLGMTRKEIERKMTDIEEFSGLGDYLSLPVRTYSVGMVTRLSFAIATAVDPGILIIDEGLGAGDARFTEEAKERLNRLIERSSIFILASHSEKLIRSMCNQAILMESGQIKLSDSVDKVYHAYQKDPPKITS